MLACNMHVLGMLHSEQDRDTHGRIIICAQLGLA